MDAPPHGQQFNSHMTPSFAVEVDRYPEGCPCGLSERNVLPAIHQAGVNLFVFRGYVPEFKTEMRKCLDTVIDIFARISQLSRCDTISDLTRSILGTCEK
jgi:hypothetical protein